MKKSEFFCYILLSIIAMIGLILVLIDLVYNFFNKRKLILFLPYRYFGLVIFSIAIILIVFSLLKNDHYSEKNLKDNFRKNKDYLNNLDDIITDMDKKESEMHE